MIFFFRGELGEGLPWAKGQNVPVPPLVGILIFTSFGLFATTR